MSPTPIPRPLALAYLRCPPGALAPPFDHTRADWNRRFREALSLGAQTALAMHNDRLAADRETARLINKQWREALRAWDERAEAS